MKEVELDFKLVRHGQLWNAFVLDRTDHEFKPLLPDYTLLSSALGVMEDEMRKQALKTR